MPEFKFQIGDTLRHKGFGKERFRYARLFVVERDEQECPGGTQRHYACRVIFTNTTANQFDMIRFNEIELEAIPDEADPVEQAVAGVEQVVDTLTAQIRERARKAKPGDIKPE